MGIAVWWHAGRFAAADLVAGTRNGLCDFADSDCVSLYIGFAVADGRPIIIAVESSIAALFVVVAAAAITGPAWLLVIGLLGHALKDLWQHRRQYVAGTRWWTPFCCTVDLVAAALITLAILGGIL